MKILVVKLSDMGDVLTVTPALRALRESFDDAHITILVPPTSAAVIRGSPLVDDVLVFDKFPFDAPRDALRLRSLGSGIDLFRRLWREKFDVVLLMHHLTTRWGAVKHALLTLATGARQRVGLDNGRGWFLTQRAKDHGFGHVHEVEYWLEVAKLLGANTEEAHLEVALSPEDEHFAIHHLPSAEGRPLVAIHPGSGGYSRARRWSSAGFARVAKELVRLYDATIVLVGGGEERELVQQIARDLDPQPINLVGLTTVKQLAAVLHRCQLFIGNDSGVMHLATAVGTPVVAIFGPSNPKAWGPWPGPKGKARVVRLDLPCSPCLYVDGRVGNRKGCEAMTCLEDIKPEMVLKAALPILSSYER